MTEQLRDPATAPKDGALILGDFGGSHLQPAIWNPTGKEWTIAEPAFNFIELGKVETKYNDVWFETEQEAPAHLNGWLPVPMVDHKTGKIAA